MKFVDEAKIFVEAGKGGEGASSFLRLKFMPFGGPDGGNGGDGGSVFLRAEEGINTLIDYRYIHRYKARDGERGAGRNCTGRSGEDLYLPVPVGTMIYDEDTNELIADLVDPHQIACVAKGGRHGIGNSRFKSSVNRSPRQTIPAELGDSRNLRLELKVLADVGLVGLPNAGKSTLISAMSAARPKIADYPFTTLHPYLGVVRVGQFRSFVMADIPGLIEGASAGAGLGIQFLRHIMRTRLLFHVLDVAPNDGTDPVEQVHVITQELAKFNEALLQKERWLVLNKVDLLPPEDQLEVCQSIIKRLNWQGKVFIVSGLAKTGLTELAQEAANRLDQMSKDPEELSEPL
ncbi:MAG: Obg family GTPase CgtA [Gammaproteobacteria bacterium]|nr:Obg family GTPase CgtA [Gammaproteobacteria bacterium]